MMATDLIPQTAHSFHRRTLLTVRQLAERHPAFTEPALRNLIFKVGRDRSAVPHRDALEAALRRVGRRVLFDEGRFLEWVDVCSAGMSHCRSAAVSQNELRREKIDD